MHKLNLFLISIVLTHNLVFSQVVANQPSDLFTCDYANTGGIAEFDLRVNDQQIIGAQDAANFEINYFVTQADAEADVNQIIQPASYVNFSNPQTIYARIENIESGCFNVDVFELITIDCTDNDDDGVIDSDEDLNSNGNLDDDDTDQDNIANYMDSDDDGDNVETINEINITSGRNSDLSYTFIDTDDDNIPNHIDNDDDGDGILTIDEDYNNNGDPTDDDTDNSGIADYLESNVALNISGFKSNPSKVYPNPSNAVVFIEGVYEGVEISVYDIQGRKVNVYLNRESVNKLRFDVRNLIRGIYILKIQDNSKQKSLKLIVN